MTLRIGTRGSALARTQSEGIAAELRQLGLDAELVVIKTEGDRSATAPFAAIGPQGVFVREIEQALLSHQVDLAVHSFKDLPSTSPAGLTIAAVPRRLDPADVLLVREECFDRNGAQLPLRQGARVGTSSARRRVWIEHSRADLQVLPLRGNVPTRVGRLHRGDYDAIVLAAAGLDRLKARAEADDLDLGSLVLERLDPHVFVPAPAQGALAIQCRKGDGELSEALKALDDSTSRRVVGVERALLAKVQGGCEVAFGAHCTVLEGRYLAVAMLERSGRVLRASAEHEAPDVLAGRLWAQLREQGAGA